MENPREHLSRKINDKEPKPMPKEIAFEESVGNSVMLGLAMGCGLVLLSPNSIPYLIAFYNGIGNFGYVGWIAKYMWMIWRFLT